MLKEIDTIKKFLVDKKDYEIKSEGEAETQVKEGLIAVITHNYAIVFKKKESNKESDSKESESSDKKKKVEIEEFNLEEEQSFEGTVTSVNEHEIFIDCGLGAISLALPHEDNIEKGDKFSITIKKV